ncbi:MAG: ATP-dependent DNA helicase, partial [Actinomycetes bacterium]
PDGEVLLEVSSLGKDAQRLHAWAKTPGVSGDRDDAPDVDRRVWMANSLSGRECVGADVCAYGSQCFAANAKAKAQLADIVVTNHTLLAIEIVDSHPILPERDAIILDEAHEFMDRTTQAVTEELTTARVQRAAAMARKLMPGKLSAALTTAADSFDDAMTGYGERVRYETSLQGRLSEIPSELEAPIRKVREAAAAIVQSITADEEIIDSDALAERARVKGAVNEVKTTADKVLKMGDSHVLWYEPTFSTLHLAPLSVSHVLQENLLTKTPVIATSATLTVGKGFDAMAKTIGFDVGDDAAEEFEAGEIDPANVQMLDVGSPFDFAQQGVLYLPKHLPEPSRDGTSPQVLEELGELIDAAGGRTLALFSSWRGVEAADIHLRKVLAELPIKIITQKRGDAVGPLVERFANDETSVLLGTMSLWQGVDVPGSACILVCIDRIPFPRPDDPVMSARAAQADASGGSGFMQVSLPRAALLLAQGTGRLIRSIDDRGVVAILDSRIMTKRYGATLLNSMPPLWRTSDKAIVRQSLERLASEFSE